MFICEALEEVPGIHTKVGAGGVWLAEETCKEL